MDNHHHKARKRFGQNFLQDENIIDAIVRAVNPKPGQHLVEIGPGLGALTQELLPLAGAMDVIELDRDVIPHLHQACTGKGELSIHQADALKFDFAALAGTGNKLRLIGNLPYNISTPLLFHLMDQQAYIQDMHFMLQKEVVDRMAAGADEDDYGRLSVMIQYYCRVQPLFLVPPESFRPVPKVDSTVVRLTPHAVPPVAVKDVTSLSKVVATAFAHRRKTLRNNLKGLISEEQISTLGIDPGARAETLTLQQFGLLANLVE